MSTDVLLTVNVITYNHAPYVAKCLDSILSQKTNFKFIIRIFDDCSTDGSTEICQEYVNKYSDKVFLFKSEKNLGSLYNSLRSYQEINTPYYLYIESDDYRIDENGFQKQIDMLEKYKECSFCCGKTINKKGEIFNDIHPILEEGFYSEKFILQNPDILFFTNLMTRIVRTKYININNEYPEAYLSDVTQMYELIVNGPFYFIPDILGCYVKTGNGVITSKDLFSKVYITFNSCYKYNLYTNNKFELNILRYFIIDISAFYYEKIIKPDVLQNNNNKKNKNLLNVLKFVSYLLIPGIFPYIVHRIRDILRHLRKRRKK